MASQSVFSLFDLSAIMVPASSFAVPDGLPYLQNFLLGQDFDGCEALNIDGTAMHIASNSGLSTNNLIELASQGSVGRGQRLSLQPLAIPNENPLNGAAKSMLLYGGLRTLSRPVEEEPPWLCDLIREEEWEAYAAWTMPDGRPFEDTIPAGVGDGFLTATCQARGVLYTCWPVYDACGKRNGWYKITATLLEIDLLGGEATTGVTGTLSFFCRTKTGAVPQSLADEVDGVWLEIIGSARDSFNQLCLPVPEEIERRRCRVLAQLAKARRDARPTG